MLGLRGSPLRFHHFKHEAAFQPPTDTEQPRVFDRQAKIARLLHRDRPDIGEKACTAENQATGVDPAQSPGFITRTHLTHFDAPAESPGQITNEVPEIDAIIRV